MGHLLECISFTRNQLKLLNLKLRDVHKLLTKYVVGTSRKLSINFQRSKIKTHSHEGIIGQTKITHFRKKKLILKGLGHAISGNFKITAQNYRRTRTKLIRKDKKGRGWTKLEGIKPD